MGLPNDVIDFKQLVDQMHTLGVVTMQAAADMQHCTVHNGSWAQMCTGMHAADLGGSFVREGTSRRACESSDSIGVSTASTARACGAVGLCSAGLGSGRLLRVQAGLDRVLVLRRAHDHD